MGKYVDGKGNGVDGKGDGVDGKGDGVDGKGGGVDGKGDVVDAVPCVADTRRRQKVAVVRLSAPLSETTKCAVKVRFVYAEDDERTQMERCGQTCEDPPAPPLDRPPACGLSSRTCRSVDGKGDAVDGKGESVDGMGDSVARTQSSRSELLTHGTGEARAKASGKGLGVRFCVRRKRARMYWHVVRIILPARRARDNSEHKSSYLVQKQNARDVLHLAPYGGVLLQPGVDGAQESRNPWVWFVDLDTKTCTR
eukprot:1189561-Prorocentrum_minimum.AAC.1